MTDEKAEDFELLGNMNMAVSPFGVQVKGLLKTHGPDVCKDDPSCCIHNPSDHPLKNMPLNWRSDRFQMERICPHGIGHPDPDDIAHKRRALEPEVFDKFAFGAHGCDGCCTGRTA
jgi:hypothetical protein